MDKKFIFNKIILFIEFIMKRSNKVFKNDTEALKYAKEQISWLKNKI